MNRRSLFKAVAGLVAAPLVPKVEPECRYEHKEYSRTITFDPGISSGDVTHYDLYRVSADGSRYMRVATAGPIKKGEMVYWTPTKGELIRREFNRRNPLK